MLKDEIKDLHRNIRETVDELEKMDTAERWGDTANQKAKTLLSELEHYVEREKDYYKQYRKIEGQEND